MAPSSMENSSTVMIRDLSFAFKEGPPIFENFDWTVENGSIWAILGPSGCGKTTLLYLLAGLQQPAQGSVLVNGHPVPRPRASTGLILQDHGLLPWATVRDNASLGLRMGKLYRNKGHDSMLPRPYPPELPMGEVDRWLERLEIAHLAKKYPAQLSGGQRQRVAIARTLALQPDLLLMDEPFSALDAVIRENLQDLLIELQAELGVTTIIVTHSVDEAAYLGRQTMVLPGPPVRSGFIFENEAVGSTGYRNSANYRQFGAKLRMALETEQDQVGQHWRPATQ